MRLIGFMVFLSFFMANAILLAAGFDCGEATNVTERAICTDKQLSVLDDLMVEDYRAALHKSNNTSKLKDEQRVWLNTERNKCQDNVVCLKQIYKERLVQLNAAASENHNSANATGVVVNGPVEAGRDVNVGKNIAVHNYNPEPSSLNVRPAIGYIEDNEIEYMDCMEPGDTSKWSECFAKREQPSKKFLSFLYLENADPSRAIFDLKAYIIVSDGTHTAEGSDKLSYALQNHGDGSGRVLVKEEHRKILTVWKPTRTAFCVSGRYENTSPQWQLYVGKPWWAGINDSTGHCNIVFSKWGIPTAETPFDSFKRGRGESLDECIQYAKLKFNSAQPFMTRKPA